MIRALLICVVMALAPAASAASRAEVEYEINGAFERSEWTRAERRAFALSLVANALDVYTSIRSDDRCVETNPILGRDPSAAQLIGVKVLAIGFEWWLYSSPRTSHYPTHVYGYTSAAIHGWAAWSNSRNRCFRGW